MLRVLATPRWVGWTLLAVVVVAGCGGMAYWQLLRAQSPTGSLLNAGYAFQWPLFGIFFAVLWWRMLRQEAEALAELTDDRPAPDPDDSTELPHADLPPIDGPSGDMTTAADDPSPFTARPVGVSPGGVDAAPAPGSARAEYNAMLAALAAEDERHAAATTDTVTEERARP